MFFRLGNVEAEPKSRESMLIRWFKFLAVIDVGLLPSSSDSRELLCLEPPVGDTRSSINSRDGLPLNHSTRVSSLHSTQIREAMM